jgi:hypothetical protein
VADNALNLRRPVGDVAGGGENRHTGAGLARGGDEFLRGIDARWPIRRGGPAIVDHDEDRAAGQRRRRMQGRAGEAEDDETSRGQPQQQQPERHGLRRALFRSQALQKCQRRERDSARRRRAETEQEIQSGQGQQAEQDGGGQKNHRCGGAPESAWCSAARTMAGEESVR